MNLFDFPFNVAPPHVANLRRASTWGVKKPEIGRSLEVRIDLSMPANCIFQFLPPAAGDLPVPGRGCYVSVTIRSSHRRAIVDEEEFNGEGVDRPVELVGQPGRHLRIPCAGGKVKGCERL